MDSDARERARRYYQASHRCLEEDIAALLRNPHGLVYWTPRLVALAKPVLHNQPADWEALEQSPVMADGWYVHLLTGDMRQARRVAESMTPLRWLCFQRGMRNARLHVRLWHRLLPH